MARAMSSLPVPVSPSMSTVESVGATYLTCSSTLSKTELLPRICSNLRGEDSRSRLLSIGKLSIATSCFTLWPFLIDPLTDIWGAVPELHALALTTTKKTDSVLTHQRQVLQIQNEWAVVGF